MNKREKQIILDAYRRVREINLNTGIDKDDSIKDIGMMLINLNLVNEKVEIDNEIFFKKNNLKFIQKEGYKNLSYIVSKYIGYLPYVEDVEEIAYHLEYTFTEEHRKIVENCIKMIEGN